MKASCHFLYIILFDSHCFSIGINSCKNEFLLYSECDFGPTKGIRGRFACRIRNPAPWNRNTAQGIQNPRLSWIPLHRASDFK